MNHHNDGPPRNPFHIIRGREVDQDIPSSYHHQSRRGGGGGDGDDDDDDQIANDNVNDKTTSLSSDELQRQRQQQQQQQLQQQRTEQHEQQLPPIPKPLSPPPRRSKVRDLLLNDDEIQATPAAAAAAAAASSQYYAKDSTADARQQLNLPATTATAPTPAQDDDRRSLHLTSLDGADADAETKAASTAAPASASASALTTTTTTAPAISSPIQQTRSENQEDETVKEEENSRSISSLSMKVVGSTYTGGKMQHIKKDDGLPLWRADIQYDFLNTIFSNDLAVFTPVPLRPSVSSLGSGGALRSPPSSSSAAATTAGSGEKKRFADLYIDAILHSEKTSKTLRHQITTERTSAINIAMVCLLVNLGRMNTTLCFSPEMKANLRTYHSIPCLQANVDDYEDHMYKQLQDAPRLKSILKRAADQDPNQIFTLEELRNYPPPRLNPISLIFLLSQYAPKISELHFTPPTDFCDLVMRPEVSSQSRARAFLWLMWFYLESDFSEEAALSNPFGAAEIVEKRGVKYLKIPPLELLTEAERAQENIDTKEEQVYAEVMQRQRKAILAGETQEQPVRPVNRRNGKQAGSQDESPSGNGNSKGDAATAATAATTPENSILAADTADAQTADAPEQAPTGELSRTRSSRRGTQSAAAGSTNNNNNSNNNNNNNNTQQPLATRIILKTRNPQMDGATDVNTRNLVANSSDLSSASRAQLAEMKTLAPGGGAAGAGAGSGGTITTTTTAAPRRSRPMTQHQIALAQNRQQRIDHVLSLRRAEKVREMRELRKDMERKTSVVMRAKQLLNRLPDDYDTDNDDEVVVDSQTIPVPTVNAALNQSAIGGIKIQSQSRKSWGPGALCANPATEEDYGELAQFYSSVLRKVGRRLGRWDWDASLKASKEPEPAPKPAAAAAAAAAAAPESAAAASGNGVPPPIKRGGRRRATKRSAATQDNTDAPPVKRSRTGGGRNRTGEASRRRAARSSPAVKNAAAAEAAAEAVSAANAEEGESELLSAVPARLRPETTQAESSDVDVSTISQLNDAEPMDEDIPSEPIQQPEESIVEGAGEDPDTTNTQLEPGQSYTRREGTFAGAKPTLKSIDRLRPQSHHHHHHQNHHSQHYSSQHDHEDMDSETSSIAYPENEIATSDIDGSAASGDEGTSLAEPYDVGDEDHNDTFNASDGEAGDQTHLYSDTP